MFLRAGYPLIMPPFHVSTRIVVVPERAKFSSNKINVPENESEAVRGGKSQCNNVNWEKRATPFGHGLGLHGDVRVLWNAGRCGIDGHHSPRNRTGRHLSGY